MATYGTDLTTLNDAESGTWTELASPYNAGGTPASDGENFIQGTDCRSQTTGTKSGLVFSIVYDAGADQSGSFATDDVVLIWTFYAVGANLETYANGGLRAVIGTDVSNADAYDIGGSNYARNPYGGWMNVAIDPTLTADYTIGTGNGGAWQFFGMMPYTLNAISKGTPHAVDAIRYGRGEIYCTGTACDFAGMAQYNDYNDATNGYNRFGLFQEQGGTYLWKGLMSIGQTGTSATFSDSNVTIIIDDAAKTYLAFNKIEGHNASTSFTMVNVTFISLGTVSPGSFEAVDNATIVWTGCSFGGMDTFIFDTNSTITGCSFNGCGQITHGGATLASCKFAGYEGTANTSYVIYNEAADPDGELDGCEFTMGTTLTHALEFGIASSTTIGLTDVVFSGYSASNNVNDSAIHIKRTTGTVTINVSGGSGTISYRTDGATVNIVNAVSVTVTAIDANALTPIEGASLVLEAASGGTLPARKATTITTATTTATATCTAHGLTTGDTVIIRGANEPELRGTFVVTVTGVNTFTYTIESIGGASGTGTITTSAQILAGLTNASGVVTTAGFPFSTDQPVVGVMRKGTTSPAYKSANVTGTITSSGFTANAPMVGDGA